MHTIKITPNLPFVYKRQIYQIAESNRNFFGPDWNALLVTLCRRSGLFCLMWLFCIFYVLAFQFTGFGLGLGFGLRLKHRIGLCKSHIRQELPRSEFVCIFRQL